MRGLLALVLLPLAADATMLKPAFCALALTAGARVEHVSPLKSLIEIQEKLAKLAKGKAAATDGYSAQEYQNDLRKPRGLYPLHWMKLASVRARLRDLEGDTTFGSEALMFAGYEFRGVEQVRAALEVFQTDGAQLNARILEGLRVRYPALRLHTVASLSLTSALVGLPAYMLWDPNPRKAMIGAALMPFMLTMAAVNEFGLPYLARRGQFVPARHLGQIERALDYAEDAPLSIVSNELDVKVDFHQLLMSVDITKLSAEELALFIDSSEKFMMVYFDQQWEEREFSEATKHMTTAQKYAYLLDVGANIAKYYPEGQYRHLYYDSIFYVENGQPVWLVYYRSFKQHPISSKRPPKPRVQKEAKPFWEPGWAPGAARVSP